MREGGREDEDRFQQPRSVTQTRPATGSQRPQAGSRKMRYKVVTNGVRNGHAHTLHLKLLFSNFITSSRKIKVGIFSLDDARIKFSRPVLQKKFVLKIETSKQAKFEKVLKLSRPKRFEWSNHEGFSHAKSIEAIFWDSRRGKSRRRMVQNE